VHEKKATKQSKAKKKQVKVVYISNPMKVKASASEFMALVQELTGRDASVPGPTEYSESDSVGSHPTMVPDGVKEVNDDDHGIEVPTRSDPTFDPYDDVFVPQMLENFSGFFSIKLDL
ncbi:VQ motif-containing protein, partial [Klebsiella pneumoniae]